MPRPSICFYDICTGTGKRSSGRCNSFWESQQHCGQPLLNNVLTVCRVGVARVRWLAKWTIKFYCVLVTSNNQCQKDKFLSGCPGWCHPASFSLVMVNYLILLMFATLLIQACATALSFHHLGLVLLVQTVKSLKLSSFNNKEKR